MNELYPPPELLAAAAELAAEPFEVVEGSSATPRRALGPTSLSDAITALGRFPGAVLVAGATDIGVQFNKRKISPSALIDLNRISELETIQRQREGTTQLLRLALEQPGPNWPPRSSRKCPSWTTSFRFSARRKSVTSDYRRQPGERFSHCGFDSIS